MGVAHEPTFEQALRIGARALRLAAHPLAFDAARFERMGLRDYVAVRAHKKYSELLQAAQLLAEQAGDLRAARLKATMRQARKQP